MREENPGVTLKQRVTQVAKKRLHWRAVPALLTGRRKVERQDEEGQREGERSSRIGHRPWWLATVTLQYSISQKKKKNEEKSAH